MKKTLSVVMVTGIPMFLVLSCAAAKDAAGTGLVFGSQFEGGKLYTAGRFKVLELTGRVDWTEIPLKKVLGK